MENNFDTVAEEMFSTEASADDAQTAVTAEELMQELTGEGAQTAENEGDGDQGAQKRAENQQSKDDKFSKRMRAALANQKRQLYAELKICSAELKKDEIKIISVEKA